MVESILITMGLAAIMLGAILLAAGVLLGAASQNGKTDVKSGGVVMIGPIPLVFGTDRNTAITIATLAVILMAIFYLITRAK